MHAGPRKRALQARERGEADKALCPIRQQIDSGPEHQGAGRLHERPIGCRMAEDAHDFLHTRPGFELGLHGHQISRYLIARARDVDRPEQLRDPCHFGVVAVLREGRERRVDVA